jgi:hypothetical protein
LGCLLKGEKFERFVLASLKTIRNFKDYAKSHIKIFVPAIFYCNWLVFLRLHVIWVSEKFSELKLAFRTTIWSQKWLPESCNKLSEEGY